MVLAHWAHSGGPLVMRCIILLSDIYTDIDWLMVWPAWPVLTLLYEMISNASMISFGLDRGTTIGWDETAASKVITGLMSSTTNCESYTTHQKLPFIKHNRKTIKIHASVCVRLESMHQTSKFNANKCKSIAVIVQKIWGNGAILHAGKWQWKR